jgi:hypothetical protein
MSNIISPANSFIQFSNTVSDLPVCEDVFPSCLPVNSWDDLNVQFTVISGEDPPTVDIKLNGTTLIDRLSHTKISETTVGGTNFWLTVKTNCCDMALLVATLNQHFSGTGTWRYDPGTGDIKCTGDIHAFATDLSAYGITYTVVCPCYLKITNFGDGGTPISLADLQAYLQTNYPAYGLWETTDPAGGTHTDRFYAIGDVCSFDHAALDAAMAALGHTGFTSEVDNSTIDCRLHITDFSCTDANVVDYLNQFFSSVGTWSIVAGQIVCTGDITTFNGDIPCVTYEIDNNGTPVYTHLLYGALKYTGHDLDTLMADGECFYLTATVDGDVYTSNCFTFTADRCFTTRIKYRCNEDAFGFTYFIDDGSGGNILDGYYNEVRLFFYLRHPELKASESVYRKSTGDYVKLSAIMENIWEGLVDFGNKDFHRRLFVALGHDDFQISPNESAFAQFMKDGEYAIKWEKSGGFVLDSAPATFTVKESPFHNFNSNCK